MNAAKEIGSLIKNRRKEKKLSQKELSMKIFGDDNHDASISRIEKGAWEKTQFLTINNILNALDIDLINLIKNHKN
jgi:transcriptional regulator with XRE-family HTH domain